MSAPRKGGHVWIREKCIADVRRFYPAAEKDKGYVVVAVDRSATVGRPRCYIQGPDSSWCLWLSQVKAFPRCEYCEAEGHTKTQAKADNCEVVRKEQEEKAKTTKKPKRPMTAEARS